VVCFALAWFLFDRFTEDEKAGDPSRGMVFRRVGKLRFLSAGRVWGNPLLWKDFHFLAGGWSMLFVKLSFYAVVAVAIGAFVYYESGGRAVAMSTMLDQWGALLASAMLVALVIELSVMASRILHDEWKWKTLDTLLLLPRPISRMGWSKMRGASLGLAPAIVFLLIGAVLSPDALEVTIDALGTPIGWASILGFFVFLHVTTLMSLFVKWGSLPLAFLVCMVGSYALTPVLMLAVAFSAAFDSPQAAAIPVTGLFLGLIAVLQLLIAKRVEILGGR
nr:hypothetical protein [Planctomycetota bacterium]